MALSFAIFTLYFHLLKNVKKRNKTIKRFVRGLFAYVCTHTAKRLCAVSDLVYCIVYTVVFITINIRDNEMSNEMLSNMTVTLYRNFFLLKF